jgi:hypothetical protein
MHASVRADEQLRTSHPESFDAPMLPTDTMTSANHGGFVLVETTPTLRWPAKSEATSPALLPTECCEPRPPRQK